jgi:hypothetical protein
MHVYFVIEESSYCVAEEGRKETNGDESIADAIICFNLGTPLVEQKTPPKIGRLHMGLEPACCQLPNPLGSHMSYTKRAIIQAHH